LVLLKIQYAVYRGFVVGILIISKALENVVESGVALCCWWNTLSAGTWGTCARVPRRKAGATGGTALSTQSARAVGKASFGVYDHAVEMSQIVVLPLYKRR